MTHPIKAVFVSDEASTTFSLAFKAIFLHGSACLLAAAALRNPSPLDGGEPIGVRLRPFSKLPELRSSSATEGESLLDVVINKNLQINGFGACEGTLACSTCHLIFEDNIYEKMEPMADEEMDMLDLAYGLTKLSRLGCQVTVERWMDGMTVRVPQVVKDRREKQEAEI
ncbi:hypothetical protein AOLI_G00272460 [Acnodon oligacanthus]